jgi:hypothetical protein
MGGKFPVDVGRHARLPKLEIHDPLTLHSTSTAGRQFYLVPVTGIQYRSSAYRE